MGHGPASVNANAATGPASPPVHRIDPARFAGYSYLFGQPRPEQRSHLGSDIAAARKLLGALVALLPSTDTPPPDSAIPAGYTYLLQFLAHDMVQTTVPFWAAADSGLVSRNNRGPGLRLDTLYGGGPSACPIAFVPAGLVPDDRSKLRLGRIKQPLNATSLPPGPCPVRDLPRVNLHEGTVGSFDVVNFDAAFQVYIADPRNDDSAILVQIAVLFSIAHNAIVDLIMTASPALPPEAVFGYARATLQHMYYAIIAGDLLPWVIRKDIRDRIAQRDAGSKDWLWDGTAIPLEFSHGAFRFGHAMTRDQYVFNTRQPDHFTVGETVLETNRAAYDNEFRDPLPQDWIVEWAKFFCFKGDKDFPSNDALNYAKKLAPRASTLDNRHLFRQRDTLAPDGVTLRDALSGAVAQTWTIDALVAEIRRRNPDLIPPDWAFGDPHPERDSSVRAQKIKQWLNGLVASGAGTDDQRATVTAHADDICRELPLSLFVLLEAGAANDDKLGVLGSIIVGEAIFRLVAEGRAEIAEMADAARSAIGAALWDKEIAPIADMPGLIKFAARHGNLLGCKDMPFITA